MNRVSLIYLWLLLWLLLWLAMPAVWAADSAPHWKFLLTPEHGGDGSSWGKANCQDCHVLSLIHKKAPQKTRDMVRAKGYGTCIACHGGNGTDAPRTCSLCHNRHDLPKSPRLGGKEKHDFTVTKTQKLDDGKCLVCHIESDMNGKFEPNVDLTALPDATGEFSPYTSQTDFCLRCHNRDHQPDGLNIRGRSEFGINDPLVAIEDNYRSIDRHGFVDGMEGAYYGLRDPGYRYGQRVECTDCHVMHGTRNGKLLLDDTRKGVFDLDRKLRKRPYRAIVKNGNSAQLCVLCHRMKHPEVEEGELDAGNGLSGVHDVRSNCADCHTHGEPVKGGL